MIRRGEAGAAPAASTSHAVYHTATLLPNGKVLVAGGFDVNASRSAELYDPARGRWTVTGSLNIGRDESHGDVAALRQGVGSRR